MAVDRWPFGALQRYAAGVILADPPWHFTTRTDAGQVKAPSAHYPTMSEAAILALPVGELARRDCWLVLWTTGPHGALGFACLRAWGFDYVTMGAWGKLTSTGRAVAFGTGHVRRGAAEFYIVAKRGRPVLLDGASRVRNLILDENFLLAARREHSRKPDAMHAQIAASFPGPYVELFARMRRPGWAVWGNQVEKFNDRGARQ